MTQQGRVVRKEGIGRLTPAIKDFERWEGSGRKAYSLRVNTKSAVAGRMCCSILSLRMIP